MPDGFIVKDTLLAVHTVLRDILRGEPPLGGQVGGVAGVQEGIVAGVGQEGFKRKGNDGENTGEEGKDHQYYRNDIFARFAQVDLGNLAGFAGDGGIVLAAVQGNLVQQHDRHAEDHHDDGQDAGLTGVLGVHGHILGGERAQAQVMGHGIGAHGAAEDQQDGGENGGLDHGQGYAPHGLPLGSIQNGGRLLQVGIHISENAADEDIGKGRIVQSQNHQAGEQALAPPHRHIDAEQGGEQAVGGAGDGIGIKQVLPHHGQGPLGHDVGKDKDGGQVFPPGQIGSGDQEGNQSAIKDRHQASADSQQNGVQQRRPQVGLGHAAGEKVGVIDGGIAGGLARQVGVDGTGVNFKGILHNGHNGRHGGKGQHNAQQQQYHIVGL